ncbi:hypothetical protein Q3G72_025906 [Acer saccharum]|nr:hypothetical protein Q3G72_025906 [Acer saccharum]
MARTKKAARVDEVGDSSQCSRPKKGAGRPIPPCVENPDFHEQFAKWDKRKIIPEKGINVPELIQTQIPQMITSRGWETYVHCPPRYCPHAEESEPEVEDPEPEAGDVEILSEDDESRSRWSRLLSALKHTRKLEMKERSRARAALKEQVRVTKKEILKEITASKGRMMTEISALKDGFMQDFYDLRMKLHATLYIRQKKTHPAPPILCSPSRCLPDRWTSYFRGGCSYAHCNGKVLEGTSRERERPELQTRPEGARQRCRGPPSHISPFYF